MDQLIGASNIISPPSQGDNKFFQESDFKEIDLSFGARNFFYKIWYHCRVKQKKSMDTDGVFFQSYWPKS